MRHAILLLAAVALTVLVAACGGGGEGNLEAGDSHEEAPKGTFDLPNGRSLYIKCLGSGSPTVVLEP